MRKKTHPVASYPLFTFFDFRYLFSVRAPTDTWPKWTGVKDSDEVDFVFGRPLAQPEVFGEKEKGVARFMIKSWAQFVKTG